MSCNSVAILTVEYGVALSDGTSVIASANKVRSTCGSTSQLLLMCYGRCVMRTPQHQLPPNRLRGWGG